MTKPKRSTPVDTLGELIGGVMPKDAKPKPQPVTPAPAPVHPVPVIAPVGRPRKETESHTVRFYPDEWDAIREAAYKQKRTHSDIIRMAICRDLGIDYREEN